MTFSGIHVNFSFSEELLQADFALSGKTSFREYKDDLYVKLAERTVERGWLLTVLTAASPLLDGTFFGEKEGEIFSGDASVRCGERGYWNFFVPTFDYTDVSAYAESIRRYVKEGAIAFPSELYYPVRIKTKGKYDLNVLTERGAEYIELRTFDLNPLTYAGVDARDVKFAQLFYVYLASTPTAPITREEQELAVYNFQSAARFDLDDSVIRFANGESKTVRQAAREILSEMKEFYRDFSAEITDILNFEEQKLYNDELRYSSQVAKEYSNGYASKGMELSKRRQEEALSHVRTVRSNI